MVNAHPHDQPRSYAEKMTTLTEPIAAQRLTGSPTGAEVRLPDASAKRIHHHEVVPSDDLRDSLRAMQESMDLRDQGHS
jgi:hypothetical protein